MQNLSSVPSLFFVLLATISTPIAFSGPDPINVIQLQGSTTVTTEFVANKWNIDITMTNPGGAGAAAVLEFVSPNGFPVSVAIRRIRVDVDTTQASLTVRRAPSHLDLVTVPHIDDIFIVDDGTGELILNVDLIDGDLGDTSGGRIEANAIGVVNIGGDLNADLIAIGSTMFASSSINNITIGGDIRGDIRAEQGSINGVFEIGGSQLSGEIITRVINTQPTGGGTPSNINFSSGQIRSLRAGNAPSSAVVGDVNCLFFGEIASTIPALMTTQFSGSINVALDVTAPLIIEANWLSSTEKLDIGRHLDAPPSGLSSGNRMFILGDPPAGFPPSNNLSNRIIINSGNYDPSTNPGPTVTIDDADGDGSITYKDYWAGEISIDYPGDAAVAPDPSAPGPGEILIGPAQPHPYKAPFYHALSDELGGGEIGLAPFNFHQRDTAPPAGQTRDCDPFHTELRTLVMLPSGLIQNPIDTVRIRHYGPVYAIGDVNDGPHFRVEFQPAFRPIWYNRTSQFEVEFAGTNNDPATGSRDIIIKSADFNPDGFNVAGSWRIRPVAGMVRCAQVFGNPDVRYDSSILARDLNAVSGPIHSWYQFTVDIESQGQKLFAQEQVNSFDLQTWIATPYETNADGSTDTRDFVEMLEATGHP